MAGEVKRGDGNDADHHVVWSEAYLVPVATGCLIFFGMWLILTDTPHRDRIFAAENFMMVCAHIASVTALTSLLWFRCRFRFWEHPSDLDRLGLANHLLAGLIVTETGWLLNRAFWFSYRLAKNQPDSNLANVIETNFNWVSATSLIVVAVGMTIAASPALRLVFGKHWAWACLSFFATTWMLGYQLPGILTG